MPKAKPDPELVAQARELVAMGASLREAAATLGVSAPTIKRWIEAEPEPSAPLPPAALPVHMRPPEPPPPLADVDLDDSIALVKQLIQEQRATIRAQQAAGVHGTSASSAAAVLEKLVKTLKQLQDGERKAGDGITVSAAEFGAAQADLDAKLAARIERGGVIRCADCERALSVAFGLGPATDADAPDPNAIEKTA